MLKGRKLRFYSGLLLFLLLAKVAVLFEPVTIYAPKELEHIAFILAKKYGLVFLSQKSGSDLVLSLIEGTTIGYEPIALCQSLINGDRFWLPYLKKDLESITLSVDGLYPYEAGYPNLREIKLKRAKSSLLRKIWYGSRELAIRKLIKEITFEFEPVKIALVGDIMLGRKVGEYIKKEGPLYPFLNVLDRLQSADISFANLETPTCLSGEFINLFRAQPNVIDGLVQTGFDIVSLANNHVLDYHQECMLETWERLSDAGIFQIGTGMNLKEATEGVIIENKGVRFGFLAYTETWFLYSRAGIKWTAGDYPGVAPIDKDLIVSDIKRLKKKADVIIVSLHWGIEYSTKVTKEESNLAKSIIEAGADVVFGHHPHVIKPWIVYKQKPVFYSVGNFVFDPLKPPLTEKGLLVELIYANGLKDVFVSITELKECQVKLSLLPPLKPNDIIN